MLCRDKLQSVFIWRRGGLNEDGSTTVFEKIRELDGTWRGGCGES